MTVAEFLTHLETLDIKVYVEEGRLKCNAPRGALTPALREELATRKQELIDLLGNGAGMNGDGSAEDSLSFAQQRLWFIDRMQPGSFAYNITGAMRLRGPLDLGALEKTLTELNERHEPLRTVFAERDGQPVAVVQPPSRAHIEVIDVAGAGEDEIEARLEEMLVAEGRTPFDLTRGPLFRTRVYRLDPQHHVVQMSLHHIVADGWSLGVLGREITLLYQLHAQGVGMRPPLPARYADVAARQRARLAGPLGKQQADYWRERLTPLPPLLDMPSDRPRPAVQTYNGAVEEYEFPPDLTDAIRKLGSQHSATRFMVLLAAFDVLLHRYTGLTDIAVGAPIANRNGIEAESVIGLLFNTLVMRTDLSGDPSFVDVLARVRDVALGAFANQDFPFERLVEMLRPSRDTSHSPLFQAMLIVQNLPFEAIDLAGLTISPVPVRIGSAKTDLTIEVIQKNESLHLYIEYSTDLFDGPTIQRFAEHFERVLRAAVTEPERPISMLPLVGDAERRRVLDEVNATRADVGTETVPQRIAARAAERPDAVAVQFGETKRRYAEFESRTDRLASYLRERGAKRGERIGILVERSAEMVEAVVAVLKTGAAYVPLDPSFPPDRLAYMLEDAGVSLVVSHGTLTESLPLPAGAEVVRLDADADAIAATPIDTRAEGPGFEDPAYVIYTSGSTGRPKGVVVPHGALVNLLESFRLEPGMGPDDVLVAVTTLSFDIAGLELLLPLVSGAAVVVVDRATSADPMKLGPLLESVNATVMQATPATWRLLLEGGWSGKQGLRILCGGEALSPELADRLLATGAELWNVYGPTETTIWSTMHRVSSVESPVPVGRPIANTRTYVLDGRGEPVPVGVAGELYIGGAGVALGYHNRPELTAEKFVADPFSEEPGARMYRTGDLVRRRADGTLLFLGRADDQVKVRGFRIELGEIETVLSQHPAVAQGVVVARTEGSGNASLVGYVRWKDGAGVELGELRTHLRERLPEYMVPGVLVTVENFPMTPNGKVDRRRLPEPDATAAPSRPPYVAPRDDLERTIADVWAAVLKVEQVGIDDDFFDLGGHSLLMVQAQTRIREATQRELSIVEMFRHPTVRALAGHLAGAEHARADDDEDFDERVLSFAQQRLWFIDRMQPGGHAYNISGAMRLRGRLDLGALEKTLTELVERHESLRTVFPDEDGRPIAVVQPAGPIRYTLIDLTGEADPEKELDRHIQEECRTPFDLARGPLFRVRVYRLAPDQHVVQMSLHHIVADGWSLGVLSRELTALYDLHSSGIGTPPPVPPRYARFAARERRRLDGPVGAQLAEYWRTQLAPPPPAVDLPTDRPRPALQTFDGAIEQYHIRRELADALHALGRKHGGTDFMVLLAALDVLLHRYTGLTDIAVGSPVANRNESGAEGVIGLMFNTLVMRTDLSGDPSFGELLARVRDVALGAYAHQEFPFERVVEIVKPPRDTSRSPLFQVMLLVQNMPMEPLQLPGLSIEQVPVRMGSAKTDLSVEVIQGTDGLHLFLEYNTDLFDAPTVRRFAEHFERVLRAAVAEPERPISMLPLVSDAERRRVLDEVNATRADVRTETVPQRITARAAERPDAVAVQFGETKRRYAEFESRTDRLASYLRERGAKRGERIGILVERSAEMVEAVVAVLKTGAAYVPLDPSFPPDRLAYMLEDAGVSLVVSHGTLTESLPLPAGAEVVRLDADADAIAATPIDTRAEGPGFEDPAYVIYTSGSTGRPKGVVVPHGALVNLLESFRLEPGMGPDDVLVAVTTLSFDIAGLELLLPLVSGAAVVVVDRATSADPMKLGPLLESVNATVMQATPATWRLLLEGGWSGKQGLRILCGGEALSPELADRLLATGAELWNVYGPTETTIWSTMHRVSSVESPVPVGRPIANTRTYVLDGRGEPVPVGVAGELYIGGAGVALGYHNRPELTAEKFVADPFSEEPGARMYRTGDLVRRRADGTLLFLGRADDQVKVRGFRIELGEIETVLSQHPAVAQGVVVARTEGSGNASLVGYVRWKDGAGVELGELRTHLRERLPEYMVPGVLVTVENFPMTPNGKVDRRRLPEPDMKRDAVRPTFLAPKNAMEQVVARVWQEVLRIDSVGVDDNFYDLGGHSLLMVQAQTQLRQTTGKDISIVDMFRYPTVRTLAAHLARSNGRAS